MDVLHQHALVFEDVTLGFLVQGVVASPCGQTARKKRINKYAQMFVNLSAFTIFPKQTTENPLPPHPLNLGGHPSLRGTLPLTHTCMPSLPLSSNESTSTSPRVDDGRLDNDSPILDEFLDMRTRVCVSDFWLFAGIEPDLTLADRGDRGGEPLLRTEVDHDLEGFGGGCIGYREGGWLSLKENYTAGRRVPMSRVPDRVGRR